MAAMSVIYVIFIKNLFSTHLTLQTDTNTILEREIFDIPYDEICIDFSNIKSISPAFVNQYLLLKSRSKKMINEVNISPDLEELMDTTNVYLESS
jgi:hypothetical protein